MTFFVAREALSAWLKISHYPDDLQKTMRLALQSDWSGEWERWLGEGLPFLREVYHWTGQSMPWRIHTVDRVWWTTLGANKGSPMAIALGLEGLGLPSTKSASERLDLLSKIFKEDLQAQIRHVLGEERHEHRLAIYRWSCAKGGHGIDLDLHMLADTATGVQDQAARHIAATCPESSGRLRALLESPRAHERVGAARCLSLLADAAAVPWIEAALASERSGVARAALTEARASCDPIMRGLAAQLSGADQGTYDPAASLGVSEALSELRALVYEGAAPVAVARICNVLERLREGRGLDLGIDYLVEHGVAGWDVEAKIRPACWPKGSAFDALNLPDAPGALLPIHLLLTGAHEPWFTQVLKTVEKRAQSRRFNRSRLPAFVEAVRWGWGWCVAHDVPVENLEVRVDGGAGWSWGSNTTALELVHGFLAGLSRTPGQHHGGQLPAGLRFLRARIPRDHPIRLSEVLDAQRRTKDLLPEFRASRGERG